MKGRVALLVGGAVGYVLGARAGRERYEQIKGQSQKVWQNPKVQQKKSKAQDLARDKAPGVQQKVAGVAAAAKDKVGAKVGDKVGKSQDTPTAPLSTDPPPLVTDPANPSSPTYETSVSAPHVG